MSKEKITTSNWYSDSQINAILKASLGDDAIVAPAIEVEHEFAFNEVLNTALTETFAYGKPTVIPVHMHGNHWGGMILKKNGDGLQVIFNDPLGNSMLYPERIVQQITEVVGSGISLDIIDIQKSQQINGNDCGPFSVDNLITLVRKDTWAMNQHEISALLHDRGEGSELRRGHAAALDSFDQIPQPHNPSQRAREEVKPGATEFSREAAQVRAQGSQADPNAAQRAREEAAAQQERMSLGKEVAEQAAQKARQMQEGREASEAGAAAQPRHKPQEEQPDLNAAQRAREKLKAALDAEFAPIADAANSILRQREAAAQQEREASAAGEKEVKLSENSQLKFDSLPVYEFLPGSTASKNARELFVLADVVSATENGSPERSEALANFLNSIKTFGANKDVSAEMINSVTASLSNVFETGPRVDEELKSINREIRKDISEIREEAIKGREHSSDLKAQVDEAAIPERESTPAEERSTDTIATPSSIGRSSDSTGRRVTSYDELKEFDSPKASAHSAESIGIEPSWISRAGFNPERGVENFDEQVKKIKALNPELGLIKITPSIENVPTSAKNGRGYTKKIFNNGITNVELKSEIVNSGPFTNVRNVEINVKEGPAIVSLGMSDKNGKPLSGNPKLVIEYGKDGKPIDSSPNLSNAHISKTDPKVAYLQYSDGKQFVLPIDGDTVLKLKQEIQQHKESQIDRYSEFDEVASTPLRTPKMIAKELGLEPPQIDGRLADVPIEPSAKSPEEVAAEYSSLLEEKMDAVKQSAKSGKQSDREKLTVIDSKITEFVKSHTTGIGEEKERANSERISQEKERSDKLNQESAKELYKSALRKNIISQTKKGEVDIKSSDEMKEASAVLKESGLGESELKVLKQESAKEIYSDLVRSELAEKLAGRSGDDAIKAQEVTKNALASVGCSKGEVNKFADKCRLEEVSNMLSRKETDPQAIKVAREFVSSVIGVANKLPQDHKVKDTISARPTTRKQFSHPDSKAWTGGRSI